MKSGRESARDDITERQRERLSRQLDRIERMLEDYLRTPPARDPEMEAKVERLKRYAEERHNYRQKKESPSD
jgi:hypothetical protein